MEGKGEWGYLHMLRDIMMINGQDFSDRTGVGCRGIFGVKLFFPMTEGFPLLTTKKLHTRSIFQELLWMLSGSTNNNDLKAKGVTIWDEWANPETGDLGPIYGKQWRRWWAGVNEDDQDILIDQIANLIEGIKKDPFSRRHIVNAWNVADLPAMSLTPCHCMFQVKVNPNGKLDLLLFQRSADSFLGVPFNIASYALLLHMIAQQTGYEPGTFIWVGGDVHVYSNHFEQVHLQLTRSPRAFPTLKLRKAASIFDYTLEDIEIENYDPAPAIPAPVAV